MIVSVVITTKNEEKHIGKCLESIKNQSYPQEKIEIIVVDNNSSDKTKEISKRYTEKVYNFGPERSSQRNFGAKQSSGEYILCLDADMMLSQNIIKESVEKCEREGCIALYIPERILGKGFWIKVRDFERSFYNATCIDCVRFVGKDAFLGIGGFDEDLTGPEDWDFDRRIKGVGRVCIINSPIYHNEGGFDFGRYLNKKAYYAQWFGKYEQKWGREDPVIRKQLGIRYRYFAVFTENGKYLKLFSHPVLTFSMFFLRIITGIYYLKNRPKFEDR